MDNPFKVEVIKDDGVSEYTKDKNGGVVRWKSQHGDMQLYLWVW
jgi:hypothetical protein